MIILVIIISSLSIISEIQTLHNIADELAVVVEYKGTTKGRDINGEYFDLNREFNDLIAKHNIKNASIAIDKNGELKIQEPFEITISARKSISIGGRWTLTIPIKVKATGRGMVYHKDF